MTLRQIIEGQSQLNVQIAELKSQLKELKNKEFEILKNRNSNNATFEGHISIWNLIKFSDEVETFVHYAENDNIKVTVFSNNANDVLQILKDTK